MRTRCAKVRAGNCLRQIIGDSYLHLLKFSPLCVLIIATLTCTEIYLKENKGRTDKTSSLRPTQKKLIKKIQDCNAPVARLNDLCRPPHI